MAPLAPHALDQRVLSVTAPEPWLAVGELDGGGGVALLVATALTGEGAAVVCGAGVEEGGGEAGVEEEVVKLWNRVLMNTHDEIDCTAHSP